MKMGPMRSKPVQTPHTTETPSDRTPQSRFSIERVLLHSLALVTDLITCKIEEPHHLDV
jgi:hypothetical protein